MTLVSTVIRDAYRESNLISITADPTTAEQTEALRLLNRFVMSVYGQEAGDELNPLPIGRNNISRPEGYPYYDQVPYSTQWFVPDNTRLILNLSEAQTVYLSPEPEEGARFALVDKSGNLSTLNLTVNANGRTISGSNTLVFSTNGVVAQFLYRADTGNWERVSPLLADGTFPFPEEFDDLFVIGLAMRLNPRNAVQADPQSTGAYSRLMRQFKARYRQVIQMPSELGLLNTVGIREGVWSDDSNIGKAAFNSGYPFGWGAFRL